MSSYWNKRLDAIPRGQARKTGNNERTAYLIGLNWFITRYHNTNIVIVDLDAKIIYLSTGGWDTRSTVTHMNNAIGRVAREYIWVPDARVSLCEGVMYIQVFNDRVYNKHSVFRLQGEWGVYIG